MKEKVDRILDGEAVDIGGVDYYLSVQKDDDAYRVGFSQPDLVCGQRLSLKMIKEAGNRLIELADELEERKKFKHGDDVYVVRADGNVFCLRFDDTDSGHLARVAMGVAFKSREEAFRNRDAVLAKYQALRDEGLI